MIPINVLYPPSMVATAMELTVANFYDQVPVRGKLHPRCNARHQGQRQGILLSGFAVLTIDPSTIERDDDSKKRHHALIEARVITLQARRSYLAASDVL